MKPLLLRALDWYKFRLTFQQAKNFAIDMHTPFEILGTFVALAYALGLVLIVQNQKFTSIKVFEILFICYFDFIAFFRF